MKVAQIHFRPSADSAPHVVNKRCDEVLQCHEQEFQTSGRAMSRGYVSDLTGDTRKAHATLCRCAKICFRILRDRHTMVQRQRSRTLRDRAWMRDSMRGSFNG
jgi:hypothetical protein